MTKYSSELRTQNVTRYIVPLREGGSLPALAEADDGFEYVVKFVGAGHGSKALIAELIGGEVARRLGLNVPELVLLNVDEQFGITEADEEIQDLLKASRGVNIGMHYLKGAFTIDPYANKIDPVLASKIVWTDAFLTNVDRTVMNTNMLLWHNRELWLIDHGASLYFHHSWKNPKEAALNPFTMIAKHAYLHLASELDVANEELSKKLTDKDFIEIVNMIPSDWLKWGDPYGLDEQTLRRGYIDFLSTRYSNSSIFTKTAKDERAKLFI